jgi:hypothetical protein
MVKPCTVSRATGISAEFKIHRGDYEPENTFEKVTIETTYQIIQHEKCLEVRYFAAW